ncbi:MAG: phenylalanine--tRNA ligase subunit beta [Christensenellales bacterium]|jgi:phenylalanyl-tRNA synthetase beta chain
MKVTLNWLKEYVDIDITVQALADKLVNSGFEVEEIINLADNIKGVVSGKILNITKHPDADKLRIADVDIGLKRLTIVCGADNCNLGLIVPVATVGAKLPSGLTIKEGVIRGFKSEGMLCSGAELDISEDDLEGAGYDGLLVLASDTPVGADINTILGYDDYLLNISVTANRPDCNSVIGIAREIAAILNKPMKPMRVNYKTVKDDINKYLSVEVESPELCPRYMARMVRNIKIEKAPYYIRKRLKSVGVRPINNVVDITNYVLYETGQPMHAFDIRYIEGGKIIVRRADNEKIVALDGNEYNLNNSHLAICDSKKPIAIGGIMGGEYSSIMPDTTTIVLESARFNRENIRRTSRELNLRSDSSLRFEKGIDYLSQEIALERALTLLDSAEVLEGVIDMLSEEIKEREIVFEPEKVNAVLGISVEPRKMSDILNSLSIKSELSDGKIRAVIPVYREDIDGVNDIAEEIIRMYGYHHIEGYKLPLRGGKSKEVKLIDKIKNLLIGEGMYEIVKYSFTTAKYFDMLRLRPDSVLRRAIKLRNALGEDLSVMRTTLIHSMLETISYNIARNNREGRLYECANVYIPNKLPLEELPEERMTLTIGAFGESEDFLILKGIIERIGEISNSDFKYIRAEKEYLHPGISAYILLNGKIVGELGEVHPDVLNNYDISKKVYIAELYIKPLIENSVKIRQFAPIPKYPSIVRDLALIVDYELAVGDMIDYIKDYNPLINDVRLFDVYRGSQINTDKKSVALSVELRSDIKTLKDGEAVEIIDGLLADLYEKFSAKLREQ